MTEKELIKSILSAVVLLAAMIIPGFGLTFMALIFIVILHQDEITENLKKIAEHL